MILNKTIAGDHTISGFKLYCRAIVITNIWYEHKSDTLFNGIELKTQTLISTHMDT